MQRGITKRTQINSSWMDIAASLVPVTVVTPKHENGEWRNRVHRKNANQNGHTARTQPIRESNGADGRQPSFSDFTCWTGADNIHAAPKASNAAEHTKQICFRPRPSLHKRFRRPTVGPVCSLHLGNYNCMAMTLQKCGCSVAMMVLTWGCINYDVWGTTPT